MFMGKDIGPEIAASDGAISGELKSWPPLRANQAFAVEPVRDRLLADAALGLTVRPSNEELAELGCEGGLASADLDRATKSYNVVDIAHARRKYTSMLVTVKSKLDKHTGKTGNKAPCTVSTMATAKKKPLEKPSRVRSAEVGPDGMRTGDRLRRAMIARGFDPESDQTRFAAECQLVYANGRKGVQQKIKQQHIGELLRNVQSSSKYIPIFAHVLKVRPLWLQFGIGDQDVDPEADRIRDIVSEVIRHANRGKGHG